MTVCAAVLPGCTKFEPVKVTFVPPEVGGLGVRPATERMTGGPVVMSARMYTSTGCASEAPPTSMVCTQSW